MYQLLNSRPYDVQIEDPRGRFIHGDFVYSNGRWGGEPAGSMYMKIGRSITWWSSHYAIRTERVQSAPSVSLINRNRYPDHHRGFLPVRLKDIDRIFADWTFTVPRLPDGAHRSYVVYYQLYLSDNESGQPCTGDFAIVLYRDTFPFESWGEDCGLYTINGFQMSCTNKKNGALGYPYIIFCTTSNPVPDNSGAVTISKFDLTACLDICYAKGFYHPEKYLVHLGAAWEVRHLFDVLTTNDMAFTFMMKNGDIHRFPSENPL